MTTIAQQRQEWLTKPGAVLCQCGRGDKIQYRCYHEGCQEFKNFCIDCKDEELHKHSQYLVKCYDVIVRSDKQWSLIKERYDNYVSSVKSSYKKQEPLVKYLEAAVINVPLSQAPTQVTRCISADYQQIIQMSEKLVQIMAQIESISQNGLIDQIDELNSQYEDFEKVIKKSEYLADITEDIIYQTYKSAIQVNHSKGFEDFSQYHRDAYIRLKLRDLPYQQTVAPETQPTLQVQEETKEEDTIFQQIDRKLKIVQSFHDSYDLSLKEVKAALQTLRGNSSNLKSFDDSARAITLDMEQSKAATDFKFNQKIQTLEEFVPNMGLNQWSADVTRSASSIQNENAGVLHGELYYTGPGYHSWNSKTHDQNQWYQFTFKDIVSVSDIQTRGRGNADNWVKSFKLQVSNDCAYWAWAESESKLYPANSDRDTIVNTKLASPIKCKAIRIIPWEWNKNIAMRCDVSLVP